MSRNETKYITFLPNISLVPLLLMPWEESQHSIMSLNALTFQNLSTPVIIILHSLSANSWMCIYVLRIHFRTIIFPSYFILIEEKIFFLSVTAFYPQKITWFFFCFNCIIDLREIEEWVVQLKKEQKKWKFYHWKD